MGIVALLQCTDIFTVIIIAFLKSSAVTEKRRFYIVGYKMCTSIRILASTGKKNGTAEAFQRHFV